MANTDKRETKDILLSEIHADHTWNARGTRWQTKSTEEDMGFAGLVESIRADGQDEPVCVRPNPDPKGKHKYLLVFGFRRFEAISKIASEAGEKNPTIRAEIRVMNDAQARAANTRENTVRDNLAVPDLAWAIAEMGRQGANDVGIAAEIGKSNTYVSDLHRIMKAGSPKVLEHWRNSIVPLTVTQMRAVVAEKEPGEQQTKYQELVKKQSEKNRVKSDEEKEAAKLDGLKKQAHKFGLILGKLDHLGFLPSESFKFAECIDTILPQSIEFDARKRKGIAKAAEEGWSEGHAEEEEAEDDEDAEAAE